jgi:two-component system, cell cycle response regulator
VQGAAGHSHAVERLLEAAAAPWREKYPRVPAGGRAHTGTFEPSTDDRRHITSRLERACRWGRGTAMRRVGTMVGVRTGVWRSRLWVWALAVGAALIAVFFVVQRSDHGGTAADIFYAGVSLLATLSICAGIAVHRPAHPLPWILFAAGQLSYTCGDVAYMVLAAQGRDYFPNLADAFYLAQFPLMTSALVVIIRRRTPGWHAPTWNDAAVLGTAATLVWWIYVIAPSTAGEELSGAALAVTIAYPVFDLLVLAAALRLSVGGGRRSHSFLLLLASLVAMLIGDGVYTVLTAAGSDYPGYWMNGVWLASYLFGAAAALHPSMRTLDARAPAPAPEPTAMRLATLAAASLLAPVVLLVEYTRGDDTRHEPAIAAACMLLFLLVLARMVGMVEVQRRTAITDGLTGLHTRGHLNQTLAVECERARRSGEPVSLIIIDVDHFKNINDGHGHLAGDAVLTEIGHRLRGLVRSVDVVARYGGEEFALLLPGAGPEAARAAGERVRQAMAELPIPVAEGTELPVRVSAGTVSMDGRTADPRRLIDAADRALYVAKRTGRNRVVSAEAPGPAGDQLVPVAR